MSESTSAFAAEVDSIWAVTPHTFAVEVSDGAWTPYEWLITLSRIIWRTMCQGGGKVLINAPPRHGKSEFISYRLPLWFLSLWPWKRVLHSTYGESLSKHYCRKVRNELKRIGGQFGLRVREDLGQAGEWALEYIDGEGNWHPSDGGMLGAGVGGAFTGRGGDLKICDDPFKNAKDASSQAKIDEFREWWRTTWMTRNEPGATDICFHTRWNSMDPTAWILEEWPGEWHHVNFPALAFKDGDGQPPDPMGRKAGDALCPERFSATTLRHIRDRSVGPRVFSPVYQGVTLDAEGEIFRRDDFKFFDRLPEGVIEWASSWDMSFKGTSHSSYVCGQVWARTGANFFLVYQVRKQMSFVETLAVFQAVASMYPAAITKLVEDKANGPAILDVLKERVPGLRPVQPRGDKVARAHAVSPLVSAGNVRLPNPDRVSWVPDFLREVTRFPNYPTNDQVDTMTQALAYWSHAPTVFIGQL